MQRRAQSLISSDVLASCLTFQPVLIWRPHIRLRSHQWNISDDRANSISSRAPSFSTKCRELRSEFVFLKHPGSVTETQSSMPNGEGPFRIGSNQERFRSEAAARRSNSQA